MSDVIARLRTKRESRSKLRRFWGGVAQACVGMLLAANAVLIYFYKAFAWAAFVGVWSGAMAILAGVSGVVVHLSETRCCKKLMFVVNLINIFGLYPALIVIGIAFYISDGYSDVYFRHFNKVLNLFYMIFSFFGMIAAVVQLSVVLTNNERHHIYSFDVRKRCGLVRDCANPEIMMTIQEPVASTSTAATVHIATICIENGQTDFENEGFVNTETQCTHL
jgi:hypothetical protein